MENAAINGVVAGVTVAVAPLISMGLDAVTSATATGLEKIGMTGVVDGISTVVSKVGTAVDTAMEYTGLKAVGGAVESVTNFLRVRKMKKNANL